MPTQPITGFRYLTAVLLFVAFFPHMSHAALGEPESAIADDVQRLNGSVKATDRTNYRVHEIQLPSGTVLREFAAIGGTVFAVAWSGPTVPNLRQALGQYYAAFAAAVQAKPHSGHSHFDVTQDTLVVQSSGHMRAFRGRAYVPQALPAGMTLDEIR